MYYEFDNGVFYVKELMKYYSNWNKTTVHEKVLNGHLVIEKKLHEDIIYFNEKMFTKKNRPGGPPSG